MKKKIGEEIIHSDHNAIIIKMKVKGSIIDVQNSQQLPRQLHCMTRKGYKKFEEMIKEEKISQLWEGNMPVTQMYNAWNEKAMEIKGRCMTKITKKRNTYNMRTFKTMIKRLKKKKDESINSNERDLLIKRIKNIQDTY